jgi:hypothetical protein
MFVVASPIDADAPLASARETPAIPNAGKALLRRLLFEERFDMAQFPRPFGHIGPIDRSYEHSDAQPCTDGGANIKEVT